MWNTHSVASLLGTPSYNYCSYYRHEGYYVQFLFLKGFEWTSQSSFFVVVCGRLKVIKIFSPPKLIYSKDKSTIAWLGFIKNTVCNKIWMIWFHIMWPKSSVYKCMLGVFFTYNIALQIHFLHTIQCSEKSIFSKGSQPAKPYILSLSSNDSSPSTSSFPFLSSENLHVCVFLPHLSASTLRMCDVE